MRTSSAVVAGASVRRMCRLIPSRTPARSGSTHRVPCPSCAATGPGHTSETAQPTPKIAAPSRCRRSGAAPHGPAPGEHRARPRAAKESQRTSARTRGRKSPTVRVAQQQACRGSVGVDERPRESRNPTPAPAAPGTEPAQTTARSRSWQPRGRHERRGRRQVRRDPPGSPQAVAGRAAARPLAPYRSRRPRRRDHRDDGRRARA